MTKKKNKNESFEIENRFEEIEESLTKTEQFVEKNQKQILTVVLIIVAVILGFFAFNKFYKAPKEEKAQVAIFQAQETFNANSFRLALEGVNEVGKQAPGFLDIIKEYSSTKAGNLAQYYAGICYKNLGEYDNAIKYLKNFDTDNFLLKSITEGAIGDSYFAKEEYEKAASAYNKASEFNPNNFSTPIILLRLGLTYEKLNNFEKALKVYKQIQNKYPNTPEGQSIAKFIARAEFGNKTSQN